MSQLPAEQGIEPCQVYGRQVDRLETIGRADILLLLRSRQISFGVLNCGVDVWMCLQRTKVIDRDRAPRGGRNCVALCSQRAIMLLDLIDELLEGATERDTLRTKNQIMKTLTMVWFDNEPGANIVIDKDIIENSHVRNGSVPGIALKHSWRRPAVAIDHDMRRVRRAQPVALGDRKGGTCSERAENG